MNTTLKKEIEELMNSKFVGRKIAKPIEFSGLTIKDSFIKIGIDFDIQLHITFHEKNQHLILDETEEIELQ